MRPIRIYLTACLILKAGCAIKPEFIAQPFVAPGRIAVLPFANASNSMEAPECLRQLAYRGLETGGYDLLPLESIDEKLRLAGISEGGQLDSKTPQELSDLLGASALFYGTVRSFKNVTMGFYRRREVSVSAKLVSFGGAGIWSHSIKVKRSRVSFREVRKKFARQLAVKAFEAVFSHPLYPEMHRAIKDLFQTLPSAKDPNVPTGRLMARNAP